MKQTAEVRYHEEQDVRTWWVTAIIGSLAALQWWGTIQQLLLGKPWGNKPAPNWLMVILWIAFGIGLPIAFLYSKLTTQVSDDTIDVNFRPFLKRSIPIDEVVEKEARTYSPLTEYGGWGIRGGFSGIRAINAYGNKGVELTLANGRKLMLGSQRPEELALAIDQAKEK